MVAHQDSNLEPKDYESRKWSPAPSNGVLKNLLTYCFFVSHHLMTYNKIQRYPTANG